MEKVLNLNQRASHYDARYRRSHPYLDNAWRSGRALYTPPYQSCTVIHVRYAVVLRCAKGQLEGRSSGGRAKGARMVVTDGPTATLTSSTVLAIVTSNHEQGATSFNTGFGTTDPLTTNSTSSLASVNASIPDMDSSALGCNPTLPWIIIPG